MSETPEEENKALRKFGLIMWSLRQLAGLSRVKLAKAAQVSEATVKLIEGGKHKAGAGTVIRILCAVGMPQVDTTELLKLLGNQSPQQMQIALQESPLSHEGEQVGTVVTLRFFLIPALKQS